MEYLNAFITGGIICALSQILIDKTKLTPARILVSYVVLGVILQGFGLYQNIVDFGGAGATVLPKKGFWARLPAVSAEQQAASQLQSYSAAYLHCFPGRPINRETK